MAITNDPLNYQYDLSEENNISNLNFFLKRNKNFLTQLTIGFLLISGIFAFTQKKVWRGEFQIVITKESNDFKLGDDGSVRSFVKSLGSNKSLLTEVNILKSQSVLKPVFEFVKNEKSNKPLTYKKWLNKSFKIELVRDTSVLNIFYEDTNKSLISPVLEKISQTYQTYSDRGRSISIKDGLKYLNEQIIIYREESKNALKNVLKFADENKLADINEFKDKNSKIDQNIAATILKASNDLRIIENQIKQFDAFENDSQKVEYIINSIKTPNINKLSTEILRLERKLANLKTIFLENDKSIIETVKRKNSLYKLLINEAYSKLNTDKFIAQNYLNSIYRSPEILAEYQNLINEELRLKDTLLELENEKLMLSLEQAQNKRPWELITTPNTLDNPVAPNKKLIVLLGTLLGFSFAALIAFAKEYISDKIYTREGFESNLGQNIIAEIDFLKINRLEETIKVFIKDKFTNFSENDIALISFGDVPKSNIEEVYKNISKVNKSLTVSKLDNISDAYDYSFIFILARVGFGTKSNAKEFKNRLDLLNNKSKFIILIN